MSCANVPPYILQELPDITESINYPIQNVQRVKYTCYDVSNSLIAFGATSGGIYIFNRNPCEFLQLIPNKDGAITRLTISSDNKHIAFANGRGIITVTGCDQSLNGSPSLLISKEHQGNEVTTMLWSANNTLFAGDDVGSVSVLQLQSFIAKTMFQSSSQTIMNLDSRICQLDVKDCMLLVSTLTRCYICDTSQELYRQIGQKLRDGEFGACFVNLDKTAENCAIQNTVQNFTELKKYNIVDDEVRFGIGKDLENTLIYSARPSSRLWEATIDGTVRRTHQFKQVLSKKPMKLFSIGSYNSENICIETNLSEDEGQSVNFSKIYSVNHCIFSFKRDVLYFLDIHNVDNTLWFDTYKDIVDCKIYSDFLYLWLSNGSLVSLRFMKLDTFLVKCFVDGKYALCAELCALYSDYLLSNNLSSKLHILAGLRNKLQNSDLLKTIELILEKFDSLKINDATQMKSGIYIMDNTYNAQSSLLNDETYKHNDGNKFGAMSPEALQALKDLSITVTDKFSSSKKVLKEKWEDFEEKVKHLGSEKQIIQEVNLPKRISIEKPTNEQMHVEVDNDIIYKESSQKATDKDDNSLEKDKVCKSLYQYFRLSLVSKEKEQSNLISIIESYACDISQIYHLMLFLEQYCLSIGALDESKFVPNNIFLTYLSLSEKRDNLLDIIMKDEPLYKYFVDSCLSVNMKTRKLRNMACECGFPLPYNRMNEAPVFSKLIDEFIEKQWLSQTRDQCYEICKRMPYLWRTILYLRRNEDLLNILRILLQMLDENLLHSFLPQFTLDTWDKAIKLYATLHANMCLNCNRKFDHMSVKDTLSWDNIGALVIKTVGGKNAIKVIEKNAHLIDMGGLTMKFYHACILVSMFEAYDSTATNQLTDALYSSYEFEDSRREICSLLRSSIDGQINNTALPIIVAAKTAHWGLTPLTQVSNDDEAPTKCSVINITVDVVIKNLAQISNGLIDCSLCGLPLQNEVLIKDGGLWVFKCGHIFHGECLNLNRIKLCPSCS